MLRHFRPEAIAHPVILALTERTGPTTIAPTDYRGTGLLGHDGEMGTARYRSGEARIALEPGLRGTWGMGSVRRASEGSGLHGPTAGYRGEILRAVRKEGAG
jgi:hypothetical protein